jgi:putative salt-induced outer membrane protein
MENPNELTIICAFIIFISASSLLHAQTDPTFQSELELGAIITSGNTEDQNIKMKASFEWDRESWQYGFSSDGFRSSNTNGLVAQRLYHVGRASYEINGDSFVRARASYEDDRFSGFDNQSDFSVNYGRNLLQNLNDMSLAINFGAGVRQSKQGDITNNEAIARGEGNFEWALSRSATFSQNFSIDSGSDSSIVRSESAIESEILNNLTMKFSIKLKHQTVVPLLREKTDTETAVTLVMNF